MLLGLVAHGEPSSPLLQECGPYYKATLGEVRRYAFGKKEMTEHLDALQQDALIMTKYGDVYLTEVEAGVRPSINSAPQNPSF